MDIKSNNLTLNAWCSFKVIPTKSIYKACSEDQIQDAVIHLVDKSKQLTTVTMTYVSQIFVQT